MVGSGGVSRWTHRFTVASASAMVGLQVALLFDVSYRFVAIIGLFGAVLPMVFGMAYLLVPSYVGQTLSTKRLPGVHFVVSYVGTGLLAVHELFGLDSSVATSGIVSWSIGIAIFVGTLLWTVVPALRTSQKLVGFAGTLSRRTTRVATMAIPVGVGYLIAGTVVLLSIAFDFPMPLTATFSMVVHFYATGFAALLIFALGIQLMTGFFRVVPPAPLAYLVLVCGGIAPGLLATNFYRPPWFVAGAGLESVAMVGYGCLVAIVVYRTTRQRVGLYGITLGAVAGVVSVGAAFGIVTGVFESLSIGVHVVGVLNGFLFSTIIGYAYQFFPVSSGQFWGATERSGKATILLLGTGTVLRAVDTVVALYWLRIGGVTLALLGTCGYAYLMMQRLRWRLN